MGIDVANAMAKRSKQPRADTAQDSGSRDDRGIPSSSAESSQPSSDISPYDRDRVAARAYELYMQRGGAGGSEMDDWLAAEREFSNGDPSSHDE
jgi:hypothetical protein